MKITRLEINNFRGIKRAVFENLQGLVVISGTNGAGKSCVFEAIKLIRSVYGEKTQNELNNFFGEYNINMNGDKNSIEKLFNDNNKSIFIEFDLSLSQSEINYLLAFAQKIIERNVTNIYVPGYYQQKDYFNLQLQGQYKMHNEKIDQETSSIFQSIYKEIIGGKISSRIELIKTSDNEYIINKIPFQNTLADVIFSNFHNNNNIGIIDYHSAHRVYNREEINQIGVNVNLTSMPINNYTQHALYNSNNKYTNIKNEMANAYIMETISKGLGKPIQRTTQLTDSLKELFATFFPNKSFDGPEFDENSVLKFPVSINKIKKHDINDLSSGEKEILFGYLRLRNSVPINSIILLDEPELHLNPKIANKIADFYLRKLVKEKGHQVWLITHSDALIRGCAGLDNSSIFHFQAYTENSNFDNQANDIAPNGEFEEIIFDLVGDLAGYRPNKDIIIVEGENSKFDENFLRKLFPDFCSRYNLFSAGNKNNVLKTAESLRQLIKEGKYKPIKVFSITDRDDNLTHGTNSNDFVWDCYHIENYLLDFNVILQIVNSHYVDNNSSHATSIESMRHELMGSAKEVKNRLLQTRISHFVNQSFTECIKSKFDPKSSDFKGEILQRILDTKLELENTVHSTLSESSIASKISEFTNQLNAELQNETWQIYYPGRDILKYYHDKHKICRNYDSFRNQILNKMAEMEIVPPGMKSVLDKIDSISDVIIK